MGKTILVVDDSAVVRFSLKAALASMDFEVALAGNGAEGLDFLKSQDAAASSLALIITDINMPEMDGIRFIKEVKKTSWKFLPILILTTEHDEFQKIEGRKVGAAGWLVKPYTSVQLLEVVRKFVPSRPEEETKNEL